MERSDEKSRSRPTEHATCDGPGVSHPPSPAEADPEDRDVLAHGKWGNRGPLWWLGSKCPDAGPGARN